MEETMPTTINKQKVLNHILTGLKKRYNPPETETRPILEQFLYAVCREGAPRDLADRAYQNLRERFFDWNEIRVSSSREIEDVLEGLPDTELRANRLISFL